MLIPFLYADTFLLPYLYSLSFLVEVVFVACVSLLSDSRWFTVFSSFHRTIFVFFLLYFLLKSLSTLSDVIIICFSFFDFFSSSAFISLLLQIVPAFTIGQCVVCNCNYATHSLKITFANGNSHNARQVSSNRIEYHFHFAYVSNEIKNCYLEKIYYII